LNAICFASPDARVKSTSTEQAYFKNTVKIFQHRQMFCPDGAGFALPFPLLPTLSPDGAMMPYALCPHRKVFARRRSRHFF